MAVSVRSTPAGSSSNIVNTLLLKVRLPAFQSVSCSGLTACSAAVNCMHTAKHAEQLLLMLLHSPPRSSVNSTNVMQGFN